MIVVIEIALALFVLRGLFRVGIGLLQIMAGITAGIVGVILLSTATVLHWLVLLWKTAFPCS